MARYNMDTVSVETWNFKFTDANFTNQGTWISRLIKIGPMVYAEGIITRTGGMVVDTEYTAIAQIPEAFRPRQTLYSQPLAGANGRLISTVTCHVSTGNLNLRSGTNTGYTSLWGLSWMTDDTPVYNSDVALEG
jgi:hypothetical protein